jgi:2-haloacid dehalogenase
VNPPAIEAVIFDLGGVLIEWDPRHLYRELLPDEPAVERFLAEVCTPAWNARQDEGRSFDEGVAELIDLHPGQEELIRAYADRWEEMLRGEIEGSAALLAELDTAGVPLFALTNWSTETFPIAQERFGFLRRFRDIVVSGREGVAKPDPRLFEIAVRRFGVAPSRCLYVDDSEANVEVAARLGFVVERFVDTTRLRRRMVELRLLPG